MALPLNILLPGATIAVLLLSLLIWWITGTKNRTLNQSAIADYMANYYPNTKIAEIHINEAGKLALVLLVNENLLKLVRPLGNRLVDQDFQMNELAHKNDWARAGNMHFPRQGIAFPPADFQIETGALGALLDTGDNGS